MVTCCLGAFIQGGTQRLNHVEVSLARQILRLSLTHLFSNHIPGCVANSLMSSLLFKNVSCPHAFARYYPAILFYYPVVRMSSYYYNVAYYHIILLLRMQFVKLKSDPNMRSCPECDHVQLGGPASPQLLCEKYTILMHT